MMSLQPVQLSTTTTLTKFCLPLLPLFGLIRQARRGCLVQEKVFDWPPATETVDQV